MDGVKALHADRQRVSNCSSTAASLSERVGCLGTKSFCLISDVDVSSSSGSFGLIDGASLIPTLEQVFKGFKAFATSTKVGRVFASLKFFKALNSSAKISVDVTQLSLSIVSETTSKTFEVAGKSLCKASASMKVVDKGLKLILGAVKISQAIEVKKTLRDGITSGGGVRALLKLYREKPDALKAVSPEVYKELESGKIATVSLVAAALQETSKTLKKSVILLSLCVAGIAIGVLSIVFTGGVAGIVLAALGIVSSLVLTGFDIAALIKKLQMSLSLSKRDLILNIVTIVLGVLALAISVAFAPTVAVAIGSALICGLMIASPVASMIYLKVKEQKVKEAERLQSFYERSISRMKRKATEIKDSAEKAVSKTQMAFYRVF